MAQAPLKHMLAGCLLAIDRLPPYCAGFYSFFLSSYHIDSILCGPAITWMLVDVVVDGWLYLLSCTHFIFEDSALLGHFTVTFVVDPPSSYLVSSRCTISYSIVTLCPCACCLVSLIWIPSFLSFLKKNSRKFNILGFVSWKILWQRVMIHPPCQL